MRKLIILWFLPYFALSQSVQISPNSFSNKALDSTAKLEITSLGGLVTLKGGTAEGSIQSPNSPISGRRIFGLDARGGVNGNFLIGADIGFVTSQAWSTPTARGAGINFSSKANLAGQYSSKLIIDHNGNIGLKTTSPKGLLHVMKASSGITVNDNPHLIIESDEDNFLLLNSKRSHSIVMVKKNIFGGFYISQDSLNLGIGSYMILYKLGNNYNVHFGEPSYAVNATFSFRYSFTLKKSTPITANQTYNNFNRQRASLIKVSGPFKEITGINQGVDGLILYITVAQGSFLDLQNENVNSLPQNRIITHTNANLLISGTGGATLIYDGDMQRWRVIGIAQ
jgi:hypothetical protein